MSATSPPWSARGSGPFGGARGGDAGDVRDVRAAGAGWPIGCPGDRRATPLRYWAATAYFVNAPPAKRSELGPSAANTLPSASTATPSPAAPW